jgi:predicted dehydrogenase
MAEGTFRVGIVGAGNNAAVHQVPAYQRLPQVELVA